MKRRRGLQESSLELLLDTICNTFGGVLFLAMLTSLMLAQTQREADDANDVQRPAVSAAEFTRLDTRAKAAVLEIASLRVQVQQAQRAATDLASPDADNLLRNKQAAERSAEQLRTRRATLLADVAAEQAAAAQAAGTATSENRERQRLDEEHELAKARLAAALAARDDLLASAIAIRDKLSQRPTVTTTGRAPRMRSTNKNEFALMIKYGRLYALESIRNGRAALNQDHFSLRPGLFMNVADAKPYAGIDLRVPESREAGLRNIMKGLPPSMCYVLLIVRSDSFEEYLPVKNWLVRQGYEYRLIPGDSPIHEGDADVTVQ